MNSSKVRQSAIRVKKSDIRARAPVVARAPPASGPMWIHETFAVWDFGECARGWRRDTGGAGLQSRYDSRRSLAHMRSENASCPGHACSGASFSDSRSSGPCINDRKSTDRTAQMKFVRKWLTSLL